jgi:hypothetical protein
MKAFDAKAIELVQDGTGIPLYLVGCGEKTTLSEARKIWRYDIEIGTQHLYFRLPLGRASKITMALVPLV